MRILLIILFLPFLAQARQVTVTVISGQVNAYTTAQSTYSLVDEDTLMIPSTATGYIAIGGISASAGHYIYVMNQGGSAIVMDNPFTAFEIQNCVNVKFIFRSSSGWGVFINNSSYRAMTIKGYMRGCTIKGIKIKAPGDYGMYIEHTATYSGSEDDMNHNNTFDSIKVCNGATSAPAIGFLATTNTGWWDSTRLTHIIIDSMAGGYLVDMNRCFNVYLADDTLMHSGGVADTAHRAGFYIRGNIDTAQRVVIWDIWGDAFRLNGTCVVPSKSSPRGWSTIMNCKAFKSRKYGAVEINSDLSQQDTSNSYIRPVNVQITYCTFGNFRAMGYFEEGTGGGGSPIDAYKHGGGTISVTNCIFWKSYADYGEGYPFSYKFHNGDGAGTIDDSTGTVYDPTGMVYLNDTTSAITRNPGPAVNVGSRVSYVTGSINGVARPPGGLFTIGAMEFGRFNSYIWRPRRYTRVHQ